MTLRTVAASSLILFALAGCGESSSDSPAAAGGDPTPAQTSEAGYPDCDAVWVADQKLPDAYAGCFDGTADVAAQSRVCSFGTSLVTFDGRFYAVPGSKVNETDGGLDGDTGYQAALASCTG